MSKHANKQRMKRRLIDAICRHDPDLDFERAVMGEQFKLNQYTHKQLKLMLRLGAKYSHVNTLYAVIDGIMITHTAQNYKRYMQRARHRQATDVSR